MDDKLIKELIDKIMVGDVSKEERSYILSLIDGKPELQAYYSEVMSMMDSLQSISDQKPYEEQDLLSARNELFSKLEDKNSGFSLYQLVGAIAATFLLTFSYFIFFQAPQGIEGLPGSEIVSLNDETDFLDMDVQFIGDDRVAFQGRTVNDINLQGDINDSQIQRMIKKTAASDIEIDKRVRAMLMLKESQQTKDLLISIFKNEDNNRRIRMFALIKFSDVAQPDEIIPTFSSLLKNENDFLMQQQLMEYMIDYAQKNDKVDELKSLIGE